MSDPIPNEPEMDRSDHVTVYRAVGGWQSVLVTWEWEDDKKVHGFWEPWQTGMGPYATKEEAIDDAKSWAESEEIRYVPPKEEDDESKNEDVGGTRVAADGDEPGLHRRVEEGDRRTDEDG